jgi:ribonucleoside-diphosphate reductase alpha chain
MNKKKNRPEMLAGCTMRMLTGCGNIYVTINEDPINVPVEVFCRLGKAGGCASSQTEALGRLVTLALRYDTPLEEIINELMGIGCHQPKLGQKKVLSCADALSQVLLEYSKMDAKEEPKPKEPKEKAEKAPAVVAEEVIPKIDHEKVMKDVDEMVKKEKDRAAATGACPDCGGVIAHEAGCLMCHSCGWSKC